MESRLFVKIHLTENLFTTVRFNDCYWDKENVYIETPGGVRTYDRRHILSLEIFEA